MSETETTNFTDIMNAKMAEAAQEFITSLVSKSPSANELLSALQAKELQPYLENIKITAANGKHVESAPSNVTRLKVAKVYPAQRPRKTGKKKVARRAGAPAGVRTYTSFSAEQRAQMKTEIVELVRANPGVVTTPELVDAIVKSHPPIRDHSVLRMIVELVKAGNLKQLAGRPNKYSLGKNA